MNCEQYELPIALHVEGDLTALESIQVEAHLATCVMCRNFANELRASQVAFRTTSLDDFSDALLADLRHSVMQEIADREARLSFWQRWFRPLRWQYAAAGLVALCAVSLLFWQLKTTGNSIATSETKSQVSAQNEVGSSEKNLLAKADGSVQSSSFSQIESNVQPGKSSSRRPAVRRERSDRLIVAVALPDDSPMPAPVSFASDVLPDNADDSTSTAINENAPDEIALPPNGNKVRLELQTRDPNVRIIFFVDKEPRRVTDTE